MGYIEKYSRKYQVTTNDVDFTKKMKLSAALNYFQEVSELHTEELGIGFNTLEKELGIAWVLARIKIDMVKYPLWNDEIIVETWHQIPKKYEFERDYYIRDLDGNILVKASSLWVIVDIKTRRLMKSEIIKIEYPSIFEERATDFRFSKIRPAGNAEKVYDRVIGCSDIDMNYHVNNSKYLDFIFDCFDMEVLKNYYAKSAEIHYINETFTGDIITMYKYTDEVKSGKIYVEGTNAKKGVRVFISQIEFSPNYIE